MTSRLGGAAALAAACLLLLPAPARADVTVDCSQLQNELTNGTDPVVVLEAGELCAGTYLLPNRALTLRGEDGAGFRSTDDARSLTTDAVVCRACRRAPVTAGPQVIDNLVFEGTVGNTTRRADGAPGGGMYWQGDDLTITDTTFANIDTNGPGGGLLVENIDDNAATYGSVTLSDVAFTANSAGFGPQFSPSRGGGASIIAGSVTVTDSTFTDNTATGDGGGLALALGSAPPEGRGPVPADKDAEISRTTFDGNVAAAGGYGCDSAAGGGLYAEGPALLAVGDNTYVDNVVGLSGGGECRDRDYSGGGAHFQALEVLGYTTETYRDNAAYADQGESEGGGFSVVSSGPFAGSYTGENTVVIGNDAVTTSGVPPEPPARAVGQVMANGGGIYVGGAIGNTVDLVHPTIVFNDASIAEESGAFAQGGAIGAKAADVISVDRAIVFGNTVDGAAALQIDGTNNVTLTNSDNPDACASARRAPDANGNICDTPLFEGGNAGAPVQAANSPTVNATASDGTVLDDFLHAARPSPAGGQADMGAHERQFAPAASPTPSPSPSPQPSASPTPAPVVPTPTSTPRPTPSPSGGQQGEDAGGRRRCSGRRRFPIVLRKRPGVTYVSARFRLDGKRIETRRIKGRIGAIVDLRKIRRRTIVLQIRAVTATGDVLKGKRVYHPCRKRLPKTTPPL